jgi:hypothetical protein
VGEHDGAHQRITRAAVTILGSVTRRALGSGQTMTVATAAAQGSTKSHDLTYEPPVPLTPLLYWPYPRRTSTRASRSARQTRPGAG